MKYKLEDFNPKLNKTVCGLAWTHLHLLPDGKAYSCCLSTGDPIGDYENNTLKEIWNGEQNKKFRIETLNGIKQKKCEVCYDQEERGIYSFRDSFNDMVIEHIPNILTSTKEDGTVDEMKLLYWDFRFSNVCNLKCRTCSPMHSSAWGKELLKFSPKNMDGLPALRQGNSKTILESLNEEQYKDVKRIYFAGGEPLITNEHYIILFNLEKYNRNDVELSYNTNFMNLFYKSNPVWECWNKFKNVNLYTSIDGINERGEYIRDGFKMRMYLKNLKLVRENSPHVKIGANITISILNSFHLFDLYDELISLKLHPNLININFVVTPTYYCIQNLTDELKNDWINLYEKKINNYDNQIIFKQIKTFIFHKNPIEKDIVAFRNYTKFYDKVRNEEILKILPELNGMFINPKLI